VNSSRFTHYPMVQHPQDTASIAQNHRPPLDTDYLLLEDQSDPTNPTNPIAKSSSRRPNYAAIPTMPTTTAEPILPTRSSQQQQRPRSRFSRQRGTLSLHEFKKFQVDPTINPMHNLVTAALESTNTSEQQHLEEWLVLELHKDGSRQYLKLTVRGIYRHVLNVITNRRNVALRKTMKLVNIAKTFQGGGGVVGGGSFAAQTVPVVSSSPVVVVGGGGGSETVSHPDVAVPSAKEDETTAPLGLGGSVPTNVPSETAVPTTAAGSGGSTATTTATTTTTAPAAAAATPMTIRERLGSYFHPRDMRRLVMPFSTSNEPGIIVRRHVMLLNFDPFRAIVLHDRLLVLVPRQDDDETTDVDDNDSVSATPSVSIMMDNLERRLRTGCCLTELMNIKDEMKDDQKKPKADATASSLDPSKSAAQDPTTDDDETEDDDAEFRDMKKFDWVQLPFELQCVDAVLHEVAAALALDAFDLQTANRKYLDRIFQRHYFNDDPLTIIRTIKDAIQQMQNRVSGFVTSMSSILEDDTTMALMNLSRLITHPDHFVQSVPRWVLDEESAEPELIMEANLHIGTAILNYLKLLQGQINSAKELVDQMQDARRNHLLLADIMISVFSLVVALGSVVGSFFGMNVPNGWETNTVVFKPIVNFTVLGCSLVCIFIMGVLWFSGTIPHSVRPLSKDVKLKVRKQRTGIQL
jgi:hypothetical protein